jgi:hypothetical protein
LNGITIHEFLGLKDGRFSADELSEKIQNDTIYGTVKKNIITIDCIIIDEISMLSWKLFQEIEHVCRVVRENQKPFGGIQKIFSGDFYQLKPISNIRYQDPGEIIISQPQFKHLIPHHFSSMHRLLFSLGGFYLFQQTTKSKDYDHFHMLLLLPSSYFISIMSANYRSNLQALLVYRLDC